MGAAVFPAAPIQNPEAGQPDLLTQPTLYLVGYAHLDTEWRWEYPQVIREFLPKTTRENFRLFEKYPHYVFNFSGTNRYQLIREHYPAEYATIRQCIEAGRWFPARSSIEEGDVNSPSAESMLPDCFGFPATLPSLLAHTGTARHPPPDSTTMAVTLRRRCCPRL